MENSVCPLKEKKTTFQKLAGSTVRCRKDYWKNIETAFMNRTLKKAVWTEIKSITTVLLFLH